MTLPLLLRRPAARLTLLLLVASLTLVLAPRPGIAATALVANGSFDTSSSGWRTGSTTTLARSASAHSGTGAVVLGAAPGSSRPTVILDDEPNSVASSAKGTSYVVSAWVRTPQPRMSGQLRVRQVSKAATVVSGQSFWLTSTAWTKVSLGFTTVNDKSSLDVSVLAWDVAAGQQLFVDDVAMSVAPVATAPASTPASANGPARVAEPRYALSDGAGVTARGIPINGAFFGASFEHGQEPTALEARAGASLGVHRTFWSAGQVDAAVASARQDLAAGRLPWISFKLPYSWALMTKGQGDAWATDLARRLAKLPGPVWVAFHHEPEGDGNIASWVKTQERLSPIVRGIAPNVAYTVIYTGWYQFYGPVPEYQMANIWPHTTIDVVGFDVYQTYGRPNADGSLNRNATKMRTDYFDKFEAFAKSKGTAWAIGETAMNDTASADLPHLMRQTYDDMVATHGVAMSYFDTPYHSHDSYALTTPAKTEQFGRVLRTTAHLPKLV